MRPRWKVVIADDEPIIRDGIRTSVDWEAIGMEVVGEAEDGEQALELAEELGVHVMLVDLNMPILNGIAVMKCLRETMPECRIVIITGHDEFAYAQEAIRLQVDDYVLKPANPDQLRGVMEKVAHKLEAAEHQSKHMRLASEQIHKNLSALRQRFCADWFEGDLPEEEVREQLDFLRLPPDCPRHVGLMLWPELSWNQPLRKERDRQLMLYAMENIASEWLEPYRHVVIRMPSDMIALLAWDLVPPDVFANIERSIRSYLKLGVMLHVEDVNDVMRQVPQAFKACKAKLYGHIQVSPLVKRAKQHIQLRLSDPGLGLESLAAELNVSPVYLSRLIKQELDVTFVQLVTQFRIHKAVQLLNATDLPIHEIAERTGYESQHYFSTAFKKFMGVSPNQYRKGAGG